MPPRRAKQEVRIMVDETVDTEIFPVDDAMLPLDVIQSYDGINDFVLKEIHVIPFGFI